MTSIRNMAHAPAGALIGGNRVLGALAPQDLRLLDPVDGVRLVPGRALFEAGELLRHLYFPASGVVSLVQADARGAMVEISQVGVEGIVGLTTLLGTDTARWRAVVEVEGEAWRVPVASARKALASSPTFQALALRLADARLVQLSQKIVCRLSHSPEQQFCQRLLAYADRVGGSLAMTHDAMAEALGWRRQGITAIARKLQALRAIAYSRGRLELLDRATLERLACECYWRVRDVALP